MHNIVISNPGGFRIDIADAKDDGKVPVITEKFEPDRVEMTLDIGFIADIASVGDKSDAGDKNAILEYIKKNESVTVAGHSRISAQMGHWRDNNTI